MNTRMHTRRGYLIVALVAFGLALTLLIIAATTEAAPAVTAPTARPALCKAYAWTCTRYRITLGVRYCTAYLFRCTSYYAPQAGKVAGLAAPAAGNRGGCAEGNKIWGLACAVTDFRPGYVAGVCDGGFWFSEVRTARTFRLDQAVTVQGCIMLADRLEGVAGWPLRISR